jgi:hypothetical protein
VYIVYGLSITEAGTTTALSEGPKQQEKARTVSYTKKSGGSTIERLVFKYWSIDIVF